MQLIGESPEVEGNMKPSTSTIIGLWCMLLIVMILLLTLIVILISFVFQVNAVKADLHEKATLGLVFNTMNAAGAAAVAPSGDRSAVVLASLAPLATMPLADWVNGDILRLDWAGYASKIDAVLPYFHNAARNAVTSSSSDARSGDQVDNVFKSVSEWVENVKTFQRVVDGDSAPVGNYPSVLKSTLDAFCDNLLQPEQFKRLAETCVIFTTNVETWSSQLSLKDEEMDFKRQVKAATEKVKPVCKAVARTDTASLSRYLRSQAPLPRATVQRSRATGRLTPQ
jgi:hypothetical protein